MTNAISGSNALADQAMGSAGGGAKASTARLRLAPAGPTAEFWTLLVAEAEAAVVGEPLLEKFYRRAVLDQPSFETAFANWLGAQIDCPELACNCLRDTIADAVADDPDILAAAIADLRASVDRNPAYADHLTPFLYFKGFQSVQLQRISHWLWLGGRRRLATHINSRVSEVFQVDIHPGARLGRGIFVDHATGVVIGETAVVEDDVSILQGVTLGGTGKDTGDRHPKIRRGVLLGAGSTVLGNIEVGEGAKVGAGSVVLKPVPAHVTVAGIPARIVGRADSAMPGLSMDQSFAEPEYSI